MPDKKVPAAERLKELRCFIPWLVAALSVHRRESVSACAPETCLIVSKQRMSYLMQIIDARTDPSSRRIKSSLDVGRRGSSL